MTKVFNDTTKNVGAVTVREGNLADGTPVSYCNRHRAWEWDCQCGHVNRIRDERCEDCGRNRAGTTNLMVTFPTGTLYLTVPSDRQYVVVNDSRLRKHRHSVRRVGSRWIVAHMNVGDRIKHKRTGWTGVVTHIFQRGIGAGDPGPSYRVRWDANGLDSKVRGRDVEKLAQ